MDEMNIKLSTKIMRNMVAKLMSNAISKKTGCDVDILLNEIEVKTYDGKVFLHVNMNAESSNEDFMRIVKSIGATNKKES